jgi:creatinine amidohydrolase
MRKALAESIALVPLGSIEQHGHHLPVLTDTQLVTTVAEGIEDRFGARVLRLPTLWAGASDHHLDFPGTVSLPNALYTDVIKSIVRSLVGAGAKRVLLLNGHGGNRIPGHQALTELSNETDEVDAVWTVFANYWEVAAEAMAPDRHGLTTPEITHACEYETSMMLHVVGDLVHLDRVVEVEPMLSSSFTSGARKNAVTYFKRFAKRTASGSMGRPSAATAEKGKGLIEAIINDACAFVDDFFTWPDPPDTQPR